jgi:hypothetical protein
VQAEHAGFEFSLISLPAVAHCSGALAVCVVGPEEPVMIGDCPWGRTGRRAGEPGMTGGFSKEELCEAGAVEVYESVAELRLAFADTWAQSSAACSSSSRTAAST